METLPNDTNKINSSKYTPQQHILTLNTSITHQIQIKTPLN